MRCHEDAHVLALLLVFGSLLLWIVAVSVHVRRSEILVDEGPGGGFGHAFGFPVSSISVQ